MDRGGPIDDRAAADALAKKRFIVINVMRVFGVIMVIAGMAVFRGGIGLPEWTGYLLIALGMFEAFVAPTLMARAWSSNPRNNRDR